MKTAKEGKQGELANPGLCVLISSAARSEKENTGGNDPEIFKRVHMYTK
jgi:hypothetical protein